MKILQFVKQLIEIQLKVPGFILEVFNDLRKDTPQEPPDWWSYHHPDCGIKYRGCHPTQCPKANYEKTEDWD